MKSTISTADETYKCLELIALAVLILQSRGISNICYFYWILNIENLWFEMHECTVIDRRINDTQLSRNSCRHDRERKVSTYGRHAKFILTCAINIFSSTRPHRIACKLQNKMLIFIFARVRTYHHLLATMQYRHWWIAYAGTSFSTSYVFLKLCVPKIELHVETKIQTLTAGAAVVRYSVDRSCYRQNYFPREKWIRISSSLLLILSFLSQQTDNPRTLLETIGYFLETISHLAFRFCSLESKNCHEGNNVLIVAFTSTLVVRLWRDIAKGLSDLCFRLIVTRTADWSWLITVIALNREKKKEKEKREKREYIQCPWQRSRNIPKEENCFVRKKSGKKGKENKKESKKMLSRGAQPRIVVS